MKFVLLGASVPLGIASVAHNSKGNALSSRSHHEHALLLISPRVCRTEPLPRNGPKFLLPGTRSTFTVCDTSRLRQGGVPRPQERCQCLSASSPPQPQHWAFVKALTRVMSRCSKIPEYSSIPLVSLERCHHKKNLEQDNFLLLTFCCALSWV